MNTKHVTLFRPATLGGAVALFLTSLSLATPIRAAIPPAERNALIDLYNSTEGPLWEHRSGWGGAPGTECGWERVTCDATGNTVERLDLDGNRMRGPVPPSFVNLTGLLPGELDLRWNALATGSAAVDTFLDSKHVGGNWKATQTIPPTGFAAGAPTAGSVPFTWVPVSYQADPGLYKILWGTTNGGPYPSFMLTSSKADNAKIITGLTPGTTYYFVIETVTLAHANNPDFVVSLLAPQVSVTTTPCPPIALAPPPPLGDATVGQPYKTTFSASGGTSPYDYMLFGGGFPPGMTLNSGTGELSGVPTTAGSYGFGIKAHDAEGCVGGSTYTIVTTCPSLSMAPPALPDATVGDVYSQPITIAGAAGPYMFSVDSGALPPGLVLEDTLGFTSAVVFGVPTASGTYSFVLKVRYGTNCFVARPYTITTTCPPIALTPPTLPPATAGEPYLQAVQVSGGAGPYTYAVSSGSLPSGLSLDASTGVIQGTPTVLNAVGGSFTIRATDANSCAGTRVYTIPVRCPAISLSPPALPDGTLGVPYSQTVSAAGGAQPYLYTVSAGTLPPGLSLDASAGSVAGTPTAAGIRSFTVSAQDGNGCRGSRPYSIAVSCPAITLLPANLPGATYGTPYEALLTASGGTAPYRFNVLGGPLPPGLHLDSSTGRLSGTPLPGPVATPSFTIQSEDANGCVGARTYTLTVSCADLVLTPETLPRGMLGNPYSQDVSAAGGVAPYQITLVNGNLPSGLSLLNSGRIGGIPTAAGSFGFGLEAKDAAGCLGRRAYTISIECPDLDLSPPALPDGRVGVSYNRALAASGGRPPYHFAVVSGSLPAGLTLSAEAAITGTPTTPGRSAFAVQAVDANGCAGGRPYAISIECPDVEISPSGLPAGAVGVAYSQALGASGGVGPYQFALIGGSLPAGLSLLPSGQITGQPTAAGTFTANVRAADASGCAGVRTYSLTVVCPAMSLLPEALAAGRVGSAYSQFLTATGGFAPHTFSVASGSLPPGLALSPNGALSGTPTGSGAFTFRVVAVDSSSAPGCSVSRDYTVTMGLEGPRIDAFTATPATIRLGESATLAWSSAGGQAAAIDNGIGSVPTTGSIAVSPRSTAVYTLTVSGPGGSASVAVTVTVTQPPCEAPAAPALLGPPNGAFLLASDPVLEWAVSSKARAYDVFLDTVTPPGEPIATNFTATSYPLANLVPNTVYYWQVFAKSDPTCPAEPAGSEIRTFSVAAPCEAPGEFQTTAPAASATGLGLPIALSWQPAAGAVDYDVFLGAGDAPVSIATGTTDTELLVRDLVAGALYTWFVVAHATCDRARTSSTREATFRVAGNCEAPGTFELVSPAPSQTVETQARLSWGASANAAEYDLYLGTDPAPALYYANLHERALDVSKLVPGATYYWRVVAKNACEAPVEFSSAVRRFQVASQCNAPQGTTISVVPPGAVGVGRTYVIGWKEAPGLDGDGSYLVERSRDAGFSSILDSQSTAGLFASFTTSQQGPHYHRVRAIAGCDPARSGPTSPVVDVPIVSGNASVVFTLQPASAIVGRGDSLASRRSVFAIENITAAPLQVRLSRTATRTPFFTVTDTSGSPVETVTLEPGQPRTLEVRFSGPPADRAGAYEGLLVLSAVGSALPVTPFATVSLKVAPDAVALPGVRPTFRMAGKTVDEVAFPGLLGDDAGRPPIAVEIVNPGTAPLEIAGEIGPEGWLVAESDWNATPIPPGGARTVRLFTQRERAPQGSPLPRYTYFTVRTQAGETARLLVQDSGPLSQGTGRTSSLPPGARSFIIPTVSHVTSASGNTFVSKIVLSNVGTLETQVTLFFTPRNADGFDATQVRQATVLVKPNDVVSLADPLVRLFGMTPPISGQLEVRAPAERIGLLNVHSSIEATARAGGSFGFQMPTVVRGEGARQGDPHTIPGVAITSAFRTNLILAETSGNDGASVSVTLHDRNGVAISRRQDAVPRYGQIQYSLRDLAAGNPIEAGRLVLDVVSGGGTVIGVTTVIDNVNDDTATFISRPLEDATPSRRAFERLSNGALQTEASGTTSFVVPAVVNGFPTFPGTELPYKFRSMMGFVSGTGSPSVFRLTYRDLVAGTTLTRTVTVPARRTLEYANVLEELFGVPAGARSEGPVFVEADKNGFVYCKVYSNVGEGTLGDILPIIAVPSEALTGGGSARPIYADGLEQSVDGTRGTRSNLILNEVTGQPATVVVRLYEAANRGYPIAEQEITLEGLEKRQLSSVFRVLGLQTEERRKDRTNVLCVVTARAGPGLVSAVVSTIDNKTGDLRHTLLTPNGGVSSGGSSIGF